MATVSEVRATARARNRLALFGLIVLLSATISAQSATDAKGSVAALDGFDEFVQTAMTSWRVPGLALAVIKDGKIVLAKGYGLRNVEAKLPVTTDTLFAIGSSTKAFTTMAVGILVEEGKLSWDEPVTKYLPTFALRDSFASARMTPRDLVTHRSGLPRHDLMWYNAKLSRKELVDRLPHLEPNEDFRERFQYQNLMYLTAGHLTAEVAGMPWEEVIRTRVFAPLGMTNSNFSVLESQRTKDYALPYTLKEKIAREIGFRDITTIGPAGSINSSINDMAKWVGLHLGAGTFNGKQIVAARQIQEMHRPQMVIQSFPGLFEDREIQQPSYGLGWFIESYRGKKRVQHGGNIDGFSAMVSLLPDDGIGVVVLTNLNGTQLPGIVARHVSDRLLGLDPIDWNGRSLKRRDVNEKAAEGARRAAEDERKTGTTPAHPMDEYTGEYDHPAYGVISVMRAGARQSGDSQSAATGQGELIARFHDIDMRLTHWHFETFRGEAEDTVLAGSKLFFQFFTDVNGEIDRLTVPFEPSVAPVSFKKRPPARLSDARFLQQLTGTYAMADNPEFKMTVTLNGSTLTLTRVGQAPFELEPAYGTTFHVKGQSGFSARFTLGPQGEATGLKLIQPNGVYTLSRL